MRNNSVAQEAIIKETIDDSFGMLAIKDNKALNSTVSLKTTKRTSELHLMHSTYGHSLNGHSQFFDIVIPKKNDADNKSHKGIRVPIIYPNATFDDVVLAIGEHPSFVKEERQEMIDDIRRWITNRIMTLSTPFKNTQAEDLKLVTKKKIPGNGHDYLPLAGASLFTSHIIKDFEKVLFGFYIGCKVDSHEWRIKTENFINEIYGNYLEGRIGKFNMHKGTCRAIDKYALRREGLKLNALSNSYEYIPILGLENASIEKIIETLERKSLISHHERDKATDSTIPGYVELTRGYGISDDAVFITISLMYGVEAGFGFLLADAIDTLDKYAKWIYRNGQDEIIGDLLKEQYEKKLKKNLPISDEEIMRVIFISAMDKNNRDYFPSCSQRRFWEEDQYGFSTIESHFAFVNHVKDSNARLPHERNIGFKGVNSNKFYYAFLNKFKMAIEMGLVSDEYNLMEKKLETECNNSTPKLKRIV